MYVHIFFSLGIKGAGKCNHVGGRLLFAIADFTDNGLHRRTEKVSCTSKLNNWIVPRNLTVQPVTDIKLKKIQFGNENQTDRPTVNLYDPRAPHDGTMYPFAFQKLFQNLEEFAPNSAFVLHHDAPEDPIETEHEYVDTLCSDNVAINTSITATYETPANYT